MSRTLDKFGLPFDKATPLEHFPKALKRGVNRCERVWTGVNRCEQVGTGVKSFDQVSISALRRSYQNRCEVVNNWWGMISKSNNEERPAEHERHRKTIDVSPSGLLQGGRTAKRRLSFCVFLMFCWSFFIIGGVKYCFSWRVSRTLAKFGVPFDKATPLYIVHFPKALKRPRINAGPASIY